MILNVSRPSLHRELNKMKKQGLIRYNPRVIEIIDAKALQDLLT
jgi:Mn-dependent DtxR family transcriptional regulator